jgi:hypothetical protein
MKWFAWSASSGAWSALALSLSMAAAPVSADTPPYPQSEIITGMSWDFSTVSSLRKAVGSDLWPLTWASDGNLYGAWGDGGGFAGTDAVGRVSLGFARITGTPISGNPTSYAGTNVWGQAPAYAQYQATFGGKIDQLVSIEGVLYGWGGLWTRGNCDCTDPTTKSGAPNTRTMVWSTDLGRSWQTASWTASEEAGIVLQFGQDYRGAFDSAHVYYYYPGDFIVDPTHAYLRRVATSEITADPATPGHYQYFAGLDNGSPLWSTSRANAVPVFTDAHNSGGTYVGAVYNPALGRYIATEGHGDLFGELGFFESPTPWGPWATIAYYDDWGGLNGSAGDDNGIVMPSKWISPDGKTMWAVFSGTGHDASGDFDSFNVARVELTTSSAGPQITAPAADTTVSPGERVTAQGSGSTLSWSITLSSSEQPFASGTGASITFTVPSNATSGEAVRILLSGRGGSTSRNLAIAGENPIVTLDSVSTGETYALVTAKPGVAAYIDRDYLITALSPNLQGATLIQGANADKMVTTEDYLQFDVSEAATLYVCYSAAAAELPAWLTDGGWVRSEETCDVADGDIPARVVYQKAVAAGRITLGGNHAPPATDRHYSNYLVLVTR